MQRFILQTQIKIEVERSLILYSRFIRLWSGSAKDEIRISSIDLKEKENNVCFLRRVGIRKIMVE